MCKIFLLITFALIISSNSSRVKFGEGGLNTDHVSKITKLVREAFKNFSNTNRKESLSANPVFTGFLKILGFDVKKIGAIAINGLIFLAQMLGTSLMHKPNSKKIDFDRTKDINSENPFDWISQNADIMKIVSHVSDRNLHEYVIEYVKESSLDEDSGCLQLLICKIAPFIWAMQEAFNGTITDETPVLYRYIPKQNVIKEQSIACERNFRFCI